jgi:hypothetical protein
MARKIKEKKPIKIIVMNPEAIPQAREKVTKWLYEQYLADQNRKEVK